MLLYCWANVVEDEPALIMLVGQCLVSAVFSHGLCQHKVFIPYIRLSRLPQLLRTDCRGYYSYVLQTIMLNLAITGLSN